MIPGRSGRWRCTVSLLIAAALLAALVAAVAIPVTTAHRGYQEGIDSATRDLAKLRGIIAEAPALQQEIERLRGNANSAARYLDGATHALAAAELQERAKEVVTRNGGVLASTQVLPSRDQDGKVTVRVQMSGNTTVLQRVMYVLEAGQPLLFINNLNVQSGTRSRRGRRAAKASPSLLTVRFDLSGYTQSDHASQ